MRKLYETMSAWDSSELVRVGLDANITVKRSFCYKRDVWSGSTTAKLSGLLMPSTAYFTFCLATSCNIYPLSHSLSCTDWQKKARERATEK